MIQLPKNAPEIRSKMQASKSIDFAALAKKHGGVTMPNYAEAAKRHGGITIPTPSLPRKESKQ
jgi:hypothetical protein